MSENTPNGIPLISSSQLSAGESYHHYGVRIRQQPLIVSVLLLRVLSQEGAMRAA